MEEISKSLIYIARYAPIIPLLVFVLRFLKLSLPQKWLIGAILFSGLIEISANFASSYYGTNLPLYHLFILGELVLLSIVFHKGYPNLISIKATLYLVIGFFSLACLNILFFQGLNIYATYSRTLESLILLSLALRYFYLVLKELRVQHIEKTFSFWFSTGILIYFSSNLLLFIYSNFILSEEPETFYYTWAMHGILNILLYSFYAIALWQKE